jgi:hypothetical protein
MSPNGERIVVADVRDTFDIVTLLLDDAPPQSSSARATRDVRVEEGGMMSQSPQARLAVLMLESIKSRARTFTAAEKDAKSVARLFARKLRLSYAVGCASERRERRRHYSPMRVVGPLVGTALNTLFVDMLSRQPSDALR